ncbi:unnamed protein product [Moneuplotes crassus]|uniref:Proteasome assembly chaperone 4 n=1 Tax=Euplotes crassus TaxID=5936 RepID=A0AAD1Y6F9_EUPCR|nr:unnamed protein product [Moneuplotes crassus]
MKFEEYQTKIFGKVPLTFQYLFMDQCVYVYVGDTSHVSTNLFHAIASPYDKLPLCTTLSTEIEEDGADESDIYQLMAKRITKKTQQVVTLSVNVSPMIIKNEGDMLFHRIEKLVCDRINAEQP